MTTHGATGDGIARRCFLRQGSMGLAALASLLERDGFAGPGRLTDVAPRAKNIIFMHMIGAPSHLDLFDYKPELIARDGQTCPE
jgi:hypothetical protein